MAEVDQNAALSCLYQIQKKIVKRTILSPTNNGELVNVKLTGYYVINLDEE